MKYIPLIMLAVTMVAGCAPAKKQETQLPGEKASVTFNGVVFDKSLNGADKITTIEKDKLIIAAGAQTNHFKFPTRPLVNNAPVLFKEIDNTKPFTFIAKVSPEFGARYDAGMLFLMVNNVDRWLKFAYEQDERGLHRIVTVRTEGTSDDNNHPVIGKSAVYMKISSNAQTIAFYYSLDKKDWQLVRVFLNEYPEKILLGIGGQSPRGEGIKVTFEEVGLTPTSVADFRMGL